MTLKETIQEILGKYDHTASTSQREKEVMLELFDAAKEPLWEALPDDITRDRMAFGRCGKSVMLPLSPWFSLMDKRVTTAATKGFYIVFLIKPDLTGFLMGLISAVDANEKKGAPTGERLQALQAKVLEEREKFKDILPHRFVSENIDLGSLNDTVKAYERAFICFKEYDKNDLPSESDLHGDLHELIKAYDAFYELRLKADAPVRRILRRVGQSAGSVDLHQTKPDTLSVEKIIENVETGQWRNPKFQRGYVWGAKGKNGIEKAMYLIDSVWRGYPIGSILLWAPEDREEAGQVLRYSEDAIFKDIEAGWGERKNNSFSFILDGQQRSVTFTLIKQARWPELCVDLLKEEVLVLSDKGVMPEGVFKVHELALVNLGKMDMKELIPDGNGDLVFKIANFNSKVFKNYQVPVVTFERGNLRDAVTSFVRCNTGGELLADFDIFAASHYLEDFYYRQKVEDLQAEIARSGWGDISEGDFLKITAICLIDPEKGSAREGMKRAVILDREKLKTSFLVKEWKSVTNAIHDSVDFLRSRCGVWHQSVLPYSQMLYVTSYFYFKYYKLKGSRTAGVAHLNWLSAWFWRAIALGRYSESGTTKQLQADLKAIDELIANGNAKHPEIVSSLSMWSKKDNEVIIQPVLDAKVTYSGSQIRNGILCSLALNDPIEWKRGVKLDLADKNVARNILHGINKHHVFPKKFLKGYAEKNQNEAEFVDTSTDSISNIAFLTFEENVSMPIKDNDPKDYVKELQALNEDLETAFEKALLPAPDKLRKMNFREFLECRANILAQHICESAGLCYSEFIDSNLVLSIRNFEGRLRRFLVSREDVLTADAAMDIVDSSRREELKKRIEKNRKDSHTDLEALANELDMGTLFNILGSKKHYHAFFPDGDRQVFTAHKDNLLKANKIRHASQMDTKSVPGIKAAIDYLNGAMKGE